MIDSHLALLLLLCVAAATLVCGRLLLVRVRYTETVAARLRGISVNSANAARRRSLLSVTITGAAALGGILMRHQMLPRKTVHEAEMLLAGVNLRGDTAIAGFIGTKVLLLAGLPVLTCVVANVARLTSNTALMAALVAAGVGLVLPDYILGRRRRRRLVAIERGLPDALDLLVICIDAGLAFEPALERVTREIAPVHPHVAEELAFTVNALRISSDRRAVLLDMGTRLEVDFLRQLAATLTQSLQLGAPLSRPLRLLAQELRREEMIRVEARAARLPVLLTIPMVIFIMPTVLLVVGGPAVVQILRTM